MQSGAYIMCEQGRIRIQHSNHELRGNLKTLRNNVKYFYYHKIGHYKSERRALKKNKHKDKDDENENTTTDVFNSEII
jgi:hypothetical protein